MNSLRRYSPQAARDLFCTPSAFALLDVREQEEFSRGHLLLASCAPLSRIEFLVEKLVPCRKIPVMLMDSGTEGALSRAQRAASILASLGYEAPSVMEGGLAAWREAGFVTVTGVGALSKGFGEYVESVQQTPCLTPEEVKGMMDAGRNIAIIDVRPREEYANMHIPGGINAPGCEVTYRFADLVPDPQTQVIINCAGRTRSIIGTQTLCNAGIPNPVAALKGGTMNWQLAGFSLEYGSSPRTAPPSLQALESARQRAAAIAEKYGVSSVDAATVRQWQAEAENEPLYLFDVRQPEEYAAGHLPGSRNAPGGQLVQATDEYAAVRNARYVLIDDTEVRAIMTAHWLGQMGLPHVFVLQGGLGGSGLGRRGLEYGPEPEVAPPLPGKSGPREIDAQELFRQLNAAQPPLVVDVGFSNGHRAGHIPGAVWVPRGYLERARDAHPGATSVVLTSDSGPHAFFAAHDAVALWPRALVFHLENGTQGWTKQGFPLERGMVAPLSAEDDIWYRPYTDTNASPEAMRGYFTWEFGLIENILKDGSVKFRL
ncbi:MAG: hypothetical protein LBU75_03795 [Desulfovibrio sp.]|jgi:rhodanese-related sulfurtransferase|nr:hypothetical protein [Desulfovibrio sp.]